jgi:hypothetical protein
MSLEAPGFIKDLIATNPEGTDPKSQGDDHLRLIKQCLQTQFPGFTEGKGIDLTETQLNSLGGLANRMGVVNVNTVLPYTCVIPMLSGTTGTLPAGATAGDVCLNIANSATQIAQVWFVRSTNTIYMRYYNGSAWGAWVCQSGIGMAQTYQTPSRIFNDTFVNDTGRSIYVSVTGTATGSASLIVLRINGLAVSQGISQNSLLPITVCGIVPPAGQYLVAITSGTAVTSWVELR